MLQISLLLLFTDFHKNILNFSVFISMTNKVPLFWRVLCIVFKIPALCKGE